jgi:hypothetical protein
MEALGGEEVQLLLILNLSTRWGWVVSITTRPRYTPGERTPGTHCTGGWVGPRAGLDAETRRKILCLCRRSNPGRPVRSQTLYWQRYPGSSIVLYGYKTLSLTLTYGVWEQSSEENIWMGKLHNEGLHNLCSQTLTESIKSAFHL